MERIQRIKPYEAKKALTTVINKVSIGKEPIIFESRGKDLAVLISMEDFHMFKRMMEVLEDQMDIEEAEKALNDPENRERIPWETLKRELALLDRGSADGCEVTPRRSPCRSAANRIRHQRPRGHPPSAWVQDFAGPTQIPSHSCRRVSCRLTSLRTSASRSP